MYWENAVIIIAVISTAAFLAGFVVAIAFVIWLLRPEKGEAIEIARLTDYAPTSLYSPLRGQGALRCAPVIITKGTGDVLP